MLRSLWPLAFMKKQAAAGGGGAMPVVRGVSATPGQANGIATFATPSKPVGTAVNDILLMVTECTPGSGSVAALSGWAEHPNSPQAGTDSVLQLFWRRADGSEPATFDVTRVSDHTLADVIAISGCVTTGNPWDAAAGDTGSGTSQSIPGLTTTVANCLVLDFCSAGTDTLTAQFSGWANAALSAVTEILNHAYNGSSGGCLGASSGGKAAAGAVGATSVTLANSSNDGRIKIALKP